jgi:hypothetical protein
VIRGDHRGLVRPRRERPLLLVRLTVPFAPSEVRDLRVGLFRVLAPRVVGVTVHALVPMLRVVVVALRFHLGLRLVSLFWAFQQADPIGLRGA